MANGQPRPAFYIAVLLVVLGLVGLAVWQYGGVRSRIQSGQISQDELKQMKGGAEAPDASGITTVKEYKFVAASRLPEVKGISSYKPMADRTVRFAGPVLLGRIRGSPNPPVRNHTRGDRLDRAKGSEREWSSGMRYGLVLVAAWIAIVPAIPAQAQDSGGKADLAKAQQIVNTLCAACHGADGNSPTPVNPSLAGQLAEYITLQLMHFKSGIRNNAVMAGMVANLTPEDMKSLGVFFARQKPKGLAAKDPTLVSAGQKLYRGGSAANTGSGGRGARCRGCCCTSMGASTVGSATIAGMTCW